MNIFDPSALAGRLPKRQRGHTQPKCPAIRLDQAGRLRVAHVLAILGISHSTLYSGLKSKDGVTPPRYPQPDGRDGKLPYWHTSTIKAFLER